ncbi:PREDICTED: uncharacterized protein LOC100640785 [Amphimedon queenslandica]|uniref:Large ribosomal subunit protein mL59 domain-containing protein n=1 Tax=Amphimedon queenslandica TaxID=400682 RepID=A0A1X7VGY8_AMPQE|nr:PREDICTED: uncharacterized protein LOC100640785 [Amphimedon queenslandica]|eukprot:XP_003384390.1 PREDICTED: uncharacterized protein LOC100640785 [Amphimedon queenslandica]
MAKPISKTFEKLLDLRKPKYINGRWRKPVVSARDLAEARKSLIAMGEEVPSKPLRDRGNDRPFKLSKWERNKESREDRIAENMKRMPEIIAEYRNKMAELRKKTRKVKTDEEKYRIATGRAKPDLEYAKNKKK